jgi:cytosine/adenosine deaminase-related metal-dependent hydrolase
MDEEIEERIFFHRKSIDDVISLHLSEIQKSIEWHQEEMKRAINLHLNEIAKIAKTCIKE